VRSPHSVPSRHNLNSTAHPVAVDRTQCSPIVCAVLWSAYSITIPSRLRMLILENLISRFENKNSRDLVENSSRIGITRLTLGFGRCTWNIGESASASRRCRCYKNKICRPRHRRWRRCGGRKTAAASNDVKTGRRQQLTRQLITVRVQVIASALSHTHPPRTSLASDITSLASGFTASVSNTVLVHFII